MPASRGNIWDALGAVKQRIIEALGSNGGDLGSIGGFNVLQHGSLEDTPGTTESTSTGTSTGTTTGTSTGTSTIASGSNRGGTSSMTGPCDWYQC